MTLTLGVAIPCYAGHHDYIPSLLEATATSSRPPESIAISCSSWTHSKRLLGTYRGIPVTIWYSTDVLNPAQNRNRAASLLETDLISFLDADDLPHPNRHAFVHAAFASRPDIQAVYHDYAWVPKSTRNDPFWEEPDARPLSAPFVKDPNAVGIMVLSTPPNLYTHHHAHVTVRRSLWNLFRFDERPVQNRQEDSVYGATLIAHEIPCLYLHNKLSRYFF